MNCKLKKTDMDYIVIVNHPALQKRAEELGYQTVNCFPDTLTKSESRAILNELAVLKKVVLMILFRPAENSFCDMVTSRTIASGSHLLKYELTDKEMASGGYADTIEEAIPLFPLREQMEKRMMNYGYIQSTDYEERCGNCRAYLEEDDKYCKYCGTKRGEGAFLPYNNHGAVEVVYGPPLFSKTKYKCSACGAVNIVPSTGSKDILFCPKCGQKQAKKVKEKIYWKSFLFIPVGTKEPYDEDTRPVLLTEENVRSLLDYREKYQKDISGKYCKENAILLSMQAAGLSVPSSMEDEETDEFLFPITEEEHEQMVLAYQILNTKGNLLDGHNDIACPYCGSKLNAALEYQLKDENSAECTPHHVPIEDGALLYRPFKETYDQESGELPAYLCLCCGTQFGSIIMRNKKDENK